VKERSGTIYHRWMLRRKLHALSQTLRAGRTSSPRLLQQLHRFWGNEAWSADTALLGSILKWFPRTCGTVVECGSGLSTLLLASLAAIHDRQVRSLEHDGQWAARVNNALTPMLASHALVIQAPIERYTEFDWYSQDAVASLQQIGFIVCDGPPGSTRGGRYGLVPILKDRLLPGTILLIDDSQRPKERSIIERWCRELSATVVDRQATHSVLQVGAGSNVDHSCIRTFGNGAV
jgi:hypothetical protein